jgi:hypothetical protein
MVRLPQSLAATSTVSPSFRLLDALAKIPGPAFIMPERLAKTDPYQQVTEALGSGLYKFAAGKGSFNLIAKLSSPAASILSTAVASDWPNESRAIQRLSEATQSAPRTGAPS